jgi:hypothetical protein
MAEGARFGLIDMLRRRFEVRAAAIPCGILPSLRSLAAVAVLPWRGEAVRLPAALGRPS